MGSQRMYYGLMILDSIEQKMDSHSTIIIPISIFSLCGKSEGPYQRYLGFLSRDQLGISLEEEILERNFPYLGIYKSEIIIDRSINRIDDFYDDGLERAAHHISIAYECNVVDESILQRTNSFIQQNLDKRIIFMITPYYETYWTAIADEANVINIIYSNIIEIVNEYGLEFYDFSTDSRFSSSKEFFRDSDHMNVSGALEFTRIFINQIESNRSK
jgi:hypothetical protein